MPLMPNAPLLAACSDDQADGTAGAVALRLGASERGEVRAPVQAAVAAFVVGRGYLGGDGAVLVRADGHREDDDVTSRSSPRTFSMFLIRMGSFVWLRSKWGLQ
jgi:stage V sporulation protein SpoVS